MATGRAGIRIVSNHFKTASREIVKAVDRAVRETAFNLLEESQENIRNQDAIDTGALLNSGYVEMSKTKGARDAAVARAKVEHEKGSRSQRRKKKRQERKRGKLTFATPTDKPADHFAKVAFSVSYAAAVEFGAFRAVTTYGHKVPLRIGREATRVEDKQFGTAVPPRPYLLPATEKARVWLPERVAAETAKAIRGLG
jgi:hypothetical protein